MKGQLLLNRHETDDQGSNNYKTVQLLIKGNNIFDASSCADEPIFTKKDLNYDKYELPKIISFQQFELLIRPFKNDPTYMAFAHNKKVLTWIVVIMLVSVISVFFTIFQKNDTLMLISVAAYLIGSIFFLVFMIWGIFLLNKVKKALLEYCDSLNLYNYQLKISVLHKQVENNIIRWSKLQSEFPGKYSLFQFQIIHIQIKSYRVFEEENTVKLYNRGSAFSILNCKGQQPIFKVTDFDFSKERLERIIPFEELELLFRPFKKDQAFIKMVAWHRKIQWGYLLVVFMFVPFLFNDRVILVMIYTIIWAVLIFIILYFALSKMKSLGKEEAIAFADFCKRINKQHKGVEIIAHLIQGNSEITQHSFLYCLEIKERQD